MTAKDLLRQKVRQRRLAMSATDRTTARAAVRARVLAEVASLQLPPNSTVAAYEPLRTEPGSSELLAALVEAGYRVLVPITRSDRDLDWRELGTSEPLGRAEISSASLVLVPAYAVDRAGNRLGRGGGSYDRALARVSPDARTAALIFADELVAEVPVEPWDRPVQSAVTPAGWAEFGPSGRGNS